MKEILDPQSGKFTWVTDDEDDSIPLSNGMIGSNVVEGFNRFFIILAIKSYMHIQTSNLTR